MKLRKPVGALLLAAVVAGAVAFAITHSNKTNSTNATNDKLKVVASYYPLYDIAKNVGGDKVQVTNITPAGSEPHDYEPTPQQLVEAQKAGVFVYNGATLEVWANKFLPDFKQTVINASQGINLQQGQDEAGKASSKIKDPHFWLDPVLAEQIVNNVRDGLSKADSKDKDYFSAKADSYKAELAQLDKDFQTDLANCQSRSTITSHAAFGYLAKRYNLDIASIAGVSPDVEPSAAKLAELTQMVKDKNIKYVFFESLVSPRLADTIAKETGAKTAVFDPIEGISEDDQKQGKDYLSVQRENLANLRTALSCR
jgi:zinc transport system substrate-binding protein